jgi:GntR family transcriptional regulator
MQLRQFRWRTLIPDWAIIGGCDILVRDCEADVAKDKGRLDMLMDGGAGPIYQRIVETLRREIESGAFAVGGLLPSEGSLRARFEVSRHTIREALRTLRDEGLIESRQGAGSRVLAASRPVYTYSVNSVAELLQYATEARYKINNTTIVSADKLLAEKLESRTDTRWLRVEGFRYLKDNPVPLCWTEVFILSEFSGVGVLIGRQTGTIYSFIEEMYGVRIEEVRQSLFTADMPAAAVEELHAEPGSRSIVVRRIYRLGDGVVPLVAINYHVPERLRLDWTLRRSSV